MARAPERRLPHQAKDSPLWAGPSTPVQGVLPLRPWHGPCSVTGVVRFFRRLLGVLVLDAGTFEDIEADRQAAMQSVVVVAAVCVAGGIAGTGLGLGTRAFVSGAIVALGAWLVWASTIVALGSSALAEPNTKVDIPQLLRVLGYASAPGLFLVLASMRAAAPLVLTMVSAWMMATAVVGVRQALDYRSTGRAIAVCAVSWCITVGVIAAFAMMFTSTVS